MMKEKQQMHGNPLKAPPGSVLLDLYVEIPDGRVSYLQLMSCLTPHKTEVINERLKRWPNKRGKWDYRAVELLLWAPGDEYHPLVDTLKALRPGYHVTIANVMTLCQEEAP